MLKNSRLLLAALLTMSLSTSGVVSAASGDLLWQFKTEGAIWGDLKIRNNTVYLGSDDGHMYALDTQARRLKWKLKTGAAVRSAPDFKGQRMFFSSDDGYLYSVDINTGMVFWKFDLKDGDLPRNLPANYEPWDFDWGKSSPIVKGDRVFVGSADGHLYALDVRGGELLWAFKTGDRVRGAPAVHGNTVYVGSWDKHVYALNATNGSLVWKAATGERVVSTPAVVGDLVIVGSRDAHLHAWHANTGELVWKHHYTDWSWVESSAIAGDEEGTFFIGSSDALKLSKFDAETGKEIWHFPTSGWTWGTPLLAGDTVYVGSTGADEYWQPVKRGFFAVDAKTGALRWSYQPAKAEGYVHGGVHATPAVKDGQVFVGDVDGTLYVFEE
jgi:outer membrane protein assembly factor BamB